jgi:hypothetical protein
MNYLTLIVAFTLGFFLTAFLNDILRAVKPLAVPTEDVRPTGPHLN